MTLLKWVDISGRTWIINPIHIISLTTTSDTGGLATVEFFNGTQMKIGSSKIPDFTREWYIALTKNP